MPGESLTGDAGRARPITIAVDAMGGDNAPAEVVAGAVAAAADGIDVVLTGRPGQLHPLLAAQPSLLAAQPPRPAAQPSRLVAQPPRPAAQPSLLAAHPLPPAQTSQPGPSAGARPPGGRMVTERVQIAAAEDWVAMDEGALASWRRPRSSMAVACQLVRRGQADAVVSAGSTGGIVATARLRLKAQAGVLRPALAVVLPTEPGPTLLLDAGAIADPKPEMLLQFAQLGVAYAQVACAIPEPRVGLLTIGSEPGKGNKLTRRAHELLAGSPPHGGMPIRFVGNVEGGDLLAGKADVIVTDGFTGNVALKTVEGAVAFATGQVRSALRGSAAARFGALFQRRALRELSGRMNAETYGGAALLGLEGTVVIAHGASTSRGITSACVLAADLARAHINDKIRERVGPSRASHFLRRT
jgi:glycerol-3-phosphate acyltransferase PlsX